MFIHACAFQIPNRFVLEDLANREECSGGRMVVTVSPYVATGEAQTREERVAKVVDLN